MRLFTKSARFALLLIVVTASGCRGCALRQGETSSGAEPVEECRQYEETLNACRHSKASIATQPSLLPKSDEDRARIKTLCAANLQRIRIACR